MVRWTELARDIPKGITIGCNGKTQVLRLSNEFDKIFHYEVPCELHKIEARKYQQLKFFLFLKIFLFKAHCDTHKKND